MPHLLHTIFSTFSRFDVSSAVDIVIVGLIFYGLLMLVRGTRADQILRGLIVVFIVLALATSIFHLTMVDWLLRNSPLVLLVALPIIFQPELRRALEQVGRSSSIVNHPFTVFTTAPRTSAVDELMDACRRIAEHRYGALIVIGGITGLEEFVRSGIRVEADISSELIVNIFFPNAPLHDGAVILRGEKVLAAGCVLPLTEDQSRRTLGTRHRAAVGITELTDASCIAISEETGQIALARGGHLTQDASLERLRRFITAMYHRHQFETSVVAAE